MLLELNLRSKELGKNTEVSILLPNAVAESSARFRTLWLFHGLSGDHTAWMRNTSIERYAAKYDLAVVMPSVDRSWYTNTQYGLRYFDYVTKELPTLCRNAFACMSDKREDNIVAGLSMGGYGALKAALTYPEQYGACISLSGSVDITRKGRAVNLPEWKGNFDFQMQAPIELEGSEHDLFALAQKLHEEKKEFPNIYMWCGLEDALIVPNRALDAHLSALEVKHRFDFSEGDHTWQWWDLHIQNALKWALE